MTDPLASIVFTFNTNDGVEYRIVDKVSDKTIRKIRQQIGRELLERSEYHSDGGRIVWIDDIHKICLVEGE